MRIKECVDVCLGKCECVSLKNVSLGEWIGRFSTIFFYKSQPLDNFPFSLSQAMDDQVCVLQCVASEVSYVHLSLMSVSRDYLGCGYNRVTLDMGPTVMIRFDWK